MKIIAKTIVKNAPKIAWFLFLAIKAWWLNVTVAPLDSSKRVLYKGILKGFNGSIPTGGHTFPNSIAGTNELWKKAQKIERKAKASLTMKRTIP